ncbi:DUF11 domain-containing protein [Phosphitispora sp. TUW77]|uniref:DUF11 domain-containing protein n=1 Tax=Phosphitispora sp. TUW77 TaxID=3152361 RepID=UPI003AB499C6
MSSESVDTGKMVLLTIKVTNNGPENASEVMMTYEMQDNLELGEITVSQGSYILKEEGLKFSLGNILYSDCAMAAIVLITKAPGTAINKIAVTGSGYDPIPENNISNQTLKIVSAGTDINIEIKDSFQYDKLKDSDLQVYKQIKIDCLLTSLPEQLQLSLISNGQVKHEVTNIIKEDLNIVFYGQLFVDLGCAAYKLPFAGFIPLKRDFSLTDVELKITNELQEFWEDHDNNIRLLIVLGAATIRKLS